MSAQEIKQLRQTLGMTQKQLAERLGVSIPTIKRWEAGKSQVPAYLVEFLKMLVEKAK